MPSAKMQFQSLTFKTFYASPSPTPPFLLALLIIVGPLVKCPTDVIGAYTFAWILEEEQPNLLLLNMASAPSFSWMSLIRSRKFPCITVLPRICIVNRQPDVMRPFPGIPGDLRGSLPIRALSPHASPFLTRMWGVAQVLLVLLPQTL